MIFWDSSAVVPLLLREEETPRTFAWASSDPELVVWWATPVECRSALSRRHRAGALDRAGLDEAYQHLATLQAAWVEIVPGEAVRGHAVRLLGRHPLRAADALQLAAALVWARERPDGHGFASFDERLLTAARGEGFTPLA